MIEERQLGRPILPPPALPAAVADEVARRGLLGAPATWWNETFYLHTGEHWQERKESHLTKLLYSATKAAEYILKDKEGKEQGTAAWAPNSKSIGMLAHALKHGPIYRPEIDQPDRVNAFHNGVLKVGQDRSRALSDHDESVFNLNSRPFDYDPEAIAPLWEKFIAEALPVEEDRMTLQEYFGYVLSEETKHQVMLSLSGKKRGGKGTIMRILAALVGRENAVAGSLKSLTGEFGLQPLVGKTLLTFGDVRWGIDTAREAVRLLLEISGEDAVSVNVKGKPILSVTLGVRIVFAGNYVPKVNDPSGAFAERLLCLAFTQTFAGREDRDLTAKLLAELPGIYNWALDGADRLAERGRFTVSAQSQAVKDSVVDGSRGQMGFIEEYFEFAPGEYTLESVVVTEHAEWARDEVGRSRDSTSIDDLRPMIIEAFPGVENNKETRRSVRGAEGTRKARAFKNLRLMPRATLAQMAAEQREQELFDEPGRHLRAL